MWPAHCEWISYGNCADDALPGIVCGFNQLEIQAMAHEVGSLIGVLRGTKERLVVKVQRLHERSVARDVKGHAREQDNSASSIFIAPLALRFK